MTGIPYEREVRDYLADCAAVHGLDSKYHPTEDGAVKLIWHHGNADAAGQIKATFATLTQGPAASAAPGAGIAGGRQAGLATLMTGDSPDDHTA